MEFFVMFKCVFDKDTFRVNPLLEDMEDSLQK